LPESQKQARNSNDKPQWQTETRFESTDEVEDAVGAASRDGDI